MPRIDRRRFLTISAAAACLPGVAAAALPVATWRGTAMGARAQMTLVGVEPAAAEALFLRVEAEIDRLENIFSLYRLDSEITRLNRLGRLASPSQDMLVLCSLTSAIHSATEGAFDPTVQPLWNVHAGAAAERRAPTADELAVARSLIGWPSVRFEPASVTFARPAMAVTFNGIAQGYAADCVAGLLRREGLRDVLVDMGEIRALGHRADGGGWRIGISGPGKPGAERVVTLSDGALATSSPAGTILDPARGTGHILNPLSGAGGAKWRVVSVRAPSAAVADGLSTALCLMPRQKAQTALQEFPGARIALMA